MPPSVLVGGVVTAQSLVSFTKKTCIIFFFIWDGVGRRGGVIGSPSCISFMFSTDSAINGCGIDLYPYYVG